MAIISGENSIVSIRNTSEDKLSRINIKCGDNCVVDIEGISSIHNGLTIFMKNNARLFMGGDQMINGPVRIYMHEESKVRIGNSCLFGNCDIWSSDMHSLFDISSGERINKARDILIGTNVWIGHETIILKGSKIGNGCAIGARAVVTGSTKCSSNELIVGNPARVVRSGVRWDVCLT